MLCATSNWLYILVFGAVCGGFCGTQMRRFPSWGRPLAPEDLETSQGVCQDGCWESQKNHEVMVGTVIEENFSKL